jgi:amino acid transporter
MRRFWRWTVSLIFLTAVILLVQISYSLLFKKSPSEPLKSTMPVIAVILAFIIAAIFNFYKKYKASKEKDSKDK